MNKIWVDRMRNLLLSFLSGVIISYLFMTHVVSEKAGIKDRQRLEAEFIKVNAEKARVITDYLIRKYHISTIHSRLVKDDNGEKKVNVKISFASDKKMLEYNIPEDDLVFWLPGDPVKMLDRDWFTKKKRWHLLSTVFIEKRSEKKSMLISRFIGRYLEKGIK